MPVFKDEVIVLKSINYGEADKILTVLGKNLGKFSLIAKGIRKIESKNRGNIQTLSVSKISFYKSKGMGVLMETANLFSPDYSCSNIKGIERVLSLLNKCVQEDDVSSKLYEQCFFVLKNGFKEDEVNKFRLAFLKNMGLLPYNSCSKCGKNECIEYVNLENFEIFCKKCYCSNIAVIDETALVRVDKINYVSKSLTNYIDLYVQKSFF
jgi:DNA repair protein RecO (recombination protein O)